MHLREGCLHLTVLRWIFVLLGLLGNFSNTLWQWRWCTNKCCRSLGGGRVMQKRKVLLNTSARLLAEFVKKMEDSNLASKGDLPGEVNINLYFFLACVGFAVNMVRLRYSYSCDDKTCPIFPIVFCGCNCSLFSWAFCIFICPKSSPRIPHINSLLTCCRDPLSILSQTGVPDEAKAL